MGWIWHLCLANMRKRGIRTALTVLGVVIGIISIVSLLAIGLGVKEELLNMAGIEGSVTEIRVLGVTDGKRKDRMLTDRKLQAFTDLEGVKAVYPVISVDTYVTYENYIGYWSIMGVPREYLEGIPVRHEAQEETSQRKPELLVGNQTGYFLYNSVTDNTYAELHEGEDWDFTGDAVEVQFGWEENSPSGRLTIGNMTKDDSYYVYCDIDLLKQYLKQMADGGTIPGQPVNENNENYNEWIYSSIIIDAENMDSVDGLVKDLQDMGYQVESNKEIVDYVQRTVKIIQIVLGGIGMIALIVAVIGIGNTMTTAVYDRINEIGILKVLGSDPEELLYLFLLESGILGGLGGLIGILVSYGITELFVNKLAVKLMELPKETQLAIIPWWLAVSAFFFAVILGVLAGFFPAKWAAKLRPIDAVQK